MLGYLCWMARRPNGRKRQHSTPTCGEVSCRRLRVAMTSSALSRLPWSWQRDKHPVVGRGEEWTLFAVYSELLASYTLNRGRRSKKRSRSSSIVVKKRYLGLREEKKGKEKRRGERRRVNEREGEDLPRQQYDLPGHIKPKSHG